jgi:hypothetical protein
MKIKIEQLRKIIKEEITLAKSGGHQKFLDEPDDEGAMIKSDMLAVKSMASDINELLTNDDQLPGWVQDHLSVAHENLQQVHGYLIGRLKQESIHDNSKKRISESITRITKKEIEEWSKGNWGFVAEMSQHVTSDQVRIAWEDMGGYEGSKITVDDLALKLGSLPADINMDGTGLMVLDGFVKEM